MNFVGGWPRRFDEGSGSNRPGDIEAHQIQDKGAFPPLLKFAFGLALVAMTVLDRFGAPFTASYSLHPAFIAMYVLVAAMLFSGAISIERHLFFAFVAIVAVASTSLLINLAFPVQQASTLSSWALVVALYFPFVFVLRAEIATPERWLKLMRWFSGFVMLCSVLGILQFYSQFFIRAPWLFDYREMIPAAIRGSGVYNTSNPVGDLLKANGFFLREASGLSFYTAFALICEWSLFRRKLHLAVMLLAMLLTYSGSGLLTLAVALVLPLNYKSVMRVAMAAMVGAVVLWSLGDVLNLTYTVDRIGEFGPDATTSSAYCRFVGPGQLVAEKIDAEPWSLFVGHGPGITQKIFRSCETTYAKVLLEYGILGFFAFLWLILRAINRAGASIAFRSALFVYWFLLGGQLLAPDVLLLLLILSSVWPPGTATKAEALMAQARSERADASRRIPT